MQDQLKGRKIAILATNGFEQSELAEPQSALAEAGAEVEIVSPKADSIKGWKKHDWGDDFMVDVSLDEAGSEDYDALVLPGGVMNPDNLRTDPAAVDFVRSFFDQDKPVAAICHGPWLLVEAGVLKGRRVTSYPSIRSDLANAGADWVDEEVVDDNGLVTSRKPDDLPAFNRKIVEVFAQRASRRHRAA